jgi:hypothetical protein
MPCAPKFVQEHPRKRYDELMVCHARTTTVVSWGSAWHGSHLTHGLPSSKCLYLMHTMLGAVLIRCRTLRAYFSAYNLVTVEGPSSGFELWTLRT